MAHVNFHDSAKCPNKSLVAWTHSDRSPHVPVETRGGGEHPFMMTQLEAEAPAPQPGFDEFTVQLTLAGSCRFTANLGFGEFRHTGELTGGFVVGAPGAEIVFDGDGAFDLLALAITPEQMAERVRRLADRDVQDFGAAHASLQWDSGIQRLIPSLWLATLDRPSADRNLATDLVDAIVCRLERLAGRAVPVPLPTRPSIAAWRSMLSLMHDDLGKPVSNHELAEAAGVSDFHFSRLFKKTTGLSPINYRLRLRIEMAQRLLTDQPDLSLASIAIRCGFADQSHLGRHFKRAFGVTPLQWRQTRAFSKSV